MGDVTRPCGSGRRWNFVSYMKLLVINVCFYSTGRIHLVTRSPPLGRSSVLHIFVSRGLFGGDNGWESVVTSLVPLGTAFAIYRRWSNRGAIKD